MKNSYLLPLLLTPLLSYAATHPSSDADEFESLLDEMSEIATKKSINVDYLPSVVTVINAQTFRDAGIQNIGEALNMLPGIQMQINRLGYTTTTIRGLKNPNAYRSDKIKILIDGVAMNNEAQGSASLYMDFPMQLVQKIEVLRGPGSTIYGAGAFYATINIITRLGSSQNSGQIFLGTGSYENKTIATNVHEQIGEWKIYADAYHKSNDKRLGLPDDFSDNGTHTDEAMNDTTFGLKVTNGSFELLTRYKKSTYGNFYGYEEDLDPIGDQENDHTNTYFSTQLSYTLPFNGFELETKVNYSNRKFEAAANIVSEATAASRFAVVDIPLQGGFWYSENSQEQNLEFETILSMPTYASNSITIGLGARRAEMVHDNFYSSVESTIAANLQDIINHPNYNGFRWRESKEPAYWSNPTTSLYKKNLKRDITYGYLQDLISVNDSVDISLGLRVDNYSDLETQFSSRAALVYRANYKTVFKLLYGSAFRAPTFTENYHNGHINFRAGDANLEAEKTDTYELQAIYSPDFRNKLSLNAFYSKIYNIIDLEEESSTITGYMNYDSRLSRGVEFEYNFRTELEHNFYLNASYIDTTYTLPQDGDTLQKEMSMPDISKVMLKSMYIYTPVPKLSLGTTWRYESSTSPNGLYRAPDKWPYNDGTIDAQHIFDETITYRFSANSRVRATVKNLFDAEIRNPSYYYKHEGGIPREGRNFFVSYIHNF